MVRKIMLRIWLSFTEQNGLSKRSKKSDERLNPAQSMVLDLIRGPVVSRRERFLYVTAE